jgi:hypothetical protein
MIDPMGVVLTFTRSSLDLDDPPQNLVFSAPIPVDPDFAASPRFPPAGSALFRLAAGNLPFAPSHHTDKWPRYKPTNVQNPPEIAFLKTMLHKGHETGPADGSRSRIFDRKSFL